MDERKPCKLRADQVHPDTVKSWYRTFFCDKRARSERKSEFAMRNWLKRLRPNRAEQTTAEKPTTSELNNKRHVNLNDNEQSNTPKSRITMPLKSIMRTGTQARTLSTVRFQLPQMGDSSDHELSLLDRYRRLREKPACRLVTGLILFVVLPCCLIYVAIHFVNKLNTRNMAFFRGKWLDKKLQIDDGHDLNISPKLHSASSASKEKLERSLDVPAINTRTFLRMTKPFAAPGLELADAYGRDLRPRCREVANISVREDSSRNRKTEGELRVEESLGVADGNNATGSANPEKRGLVSLDREIKPG